MTKILVTGACVALVYFCHAQTLTLKDAETGAPLIGATIQDTSERFVVTDGKGQADLSQFEGAEQLTFRMLGYSTRTINWSEAAGADFTVTLSLTGVALSELVISASKFEEVQEDVVQKIQVMRGSELQQINQTSTADVLTQSGNIMVQKSQQGGGSPIIRGFETNKVLLVVDGVRMNNAIYRGGHLQNVITLDNSIMDRVEIVFGPGSVMYGSDALGGVMHFYTKNPVLPTDGSMKIGASVYQRFMSASKGLASHADVSVGGKKWGSLTSVTYSNFGDLEQGNNRRSKYNAFGKRDWYVKRIGSQDSAVVNKNPDKQVGSAYRQYDLLQKVLFKPNEYSEHILNVQYSTSSDMPRYDRLTQISGGNPRFAEWYYGPQKRFFSAYSLNLTRANGLFDQAKFTMGHQQIEESRIDRRYRSAAKNHQIEEVKVFTANADLFRLLGAHELRYGLELTYNGVDSRAFMEDITNGSRSVQSTRYPDGGSSMQSAAIYLTHTWEISEMLVLNDGIRLSYVGLSAKFEDKAFFPFPFNSINQDHVAPSGNIGFVLMPGMDWRITGGFSSGFRAPNVDDLSKVFESVQGRVIVPNPDLKPEYTLNAELGIGKTIADRVNALVTGYYTSLKNALTVLPSTFNGQDSIQFDGQQSLVTTTENATEAFIYGLETAFSGNLTSNLSIRGSLNYTYGRIKTDSSDYPLDHIPPVFGKIQAQMQAGNWRYEVYTQFSGWKKVKNYNLIGEDNFAYATPDGMPAWATLNARTTWQATENVSLQLACENILDQNYRVFASNISAPGRNWVATLRATF